MRKALKTASGKVADDGVVVLEFTGLSTGGYAISVFYDENGNGKLDTGFRRQRDIT